MVRKSGIVATLIIFLSFILRLVVLLAGNSPEFLEQYGMFSLNVTDFKANVTGQNDTDIPRPPDFYSYHVVKTCAGFYTGTDNSTKENVTCSADGDSTSLKRVMERFADDNHELSDTLDRLNKVGNSLNPTSDSSRSNTIYYVYCIAVATISLALLGAIAGIFTDGKASAVLNMLIDVLAFVFMAVASGLANFISVTIVKYTKSHEDVGIKAATGVTFLALSWFTAILMLVASVIWSIAWGSRRRKAAKRQASVPSSHYTAEYEPKHHSTV